MKSIRVIGLLLFLIGNNCLNAEAQPDSLDLKIGQMILIGYKGHDFRPNDPVVDEIKSGRVGGIILFESNISEIEATKSLQKLTSGLQLNAPIPLFMSIDQEGGVVNRLKPKYGFPKSVTAEYLGKLDNVDSTRYYAHSMAQTLSELGFNINFAPVLDLNINQDNPIIAAHGRAFSKDPVIAARHAEIIIEELRSEKIIAVGKHFPGHGSSIGDTHKGIVDVTNTWKKDEITPYKTLIQEKQLESVMVAHIVNANLDPEMLPGSLSGMVVNGLLRDSLNFNGVAFSDDMRMKAISNYFAVKKAIELGINAGLDVLTYSINTNSKDRKIDMIHTLIKELVAEGKVSEERINLSYQRIMKLKKAYLYDTN